MEHALGDTRYKEFSDVGELFDYLRTLPRSLRVENVVGETLRSQHVDAPTLISSYLSFE